MRIEKRVDTVKLYDEIIDEKTQEVNCVKNGKTQEIRYKVLYTDEGKRFVDKNGCLLGVCIQLGTEDSEDNYMEVSDVD